MLTPEQIMRHSGPNPDEDPWVDGPPAAEEIAVVDYDPAWADTYRTLAEEIRAALGDAVLALDHVGSTSVPGFAAKPIIDIDLTVASSSDEDRYVPGLERLGYRLTIREPSFHGHRCLQRSQPAVNLHVWSPDSPELVRHAILRDWLRERPDERERYAAAKAPAADGADGDMREYNLLKQDVIREIYGRAFRARGWVDPST
ncbi:GrpB family protein [Leifsonia poae]|uniref:GrpB family protein n=1 Tax=Leifsonia poae TaxID=110933 RepID=UPI003D6927D8